MIPLLIVYVGFAGITDGVGKAWISSLAPPTVRGDAQGLPQGLTGASVPLAGVFDRVTWESGTGSGRWPLLIADAPCLSSALRDCSRLGDASSRT